MSNQSERTRNPYKRATQFACWHRAYGATMVGKIIETDGADVATKRGVADAKKDLARGVPQIVRVSQ